MQGTFSNIFSRKNFRKTAKKLIPWSIALSLMVSACSVPQTTTQTQTTTGAAPTTTATTQEITSDGSSTVYPITAEMADAFKFERRNANPPAIQVAFSGTTSGFRKFCANQSDISNASRPINTEELDTCRSAGVNFVEMPVAFDAITIAVHPDNTWAQDITVEELRKLWEPAAEGRITRWNQIRPEWPDQPINLYGPGADSGTFDYFTEVINGETGSSRKDYFPSEDDSLLVRRVRSDVNALGYFGFAYYEESKGALRSLAVDSGNGPVSPSIETVQSSQYQPLARPLLIYANADRVQQNPELRNFLDFYMKQGRLIVSTIGYVPLPNEAYNLGLNRLQENKQGSVFGGRSQPNLTIEELMLKEAQ